MIESNREEWILLVTAAERRSEATSVTIGAGTIIGPRNRRNGAVHASWCRRPKSLASALTDCRQPLDAFGLRS